METPLRKKFMKTNDKKKSEKENIYMCNYI